MKKAEILVEALPYIQKFRDKTIIIKCGGNVLEKEENRKNIANDIVLLWYVGIKPVLVHGGGIQVTTFMKKLGKESEFEKGLRKTDKETLNITEMVLGKINKDIVSLINMSGGRAIGLSGKDDRMIKVKKISKDIGFVGEIKEINSSILKILDEKGFIPVVSPLGVDDKGNTYNINADLAAAWIAVNLKAEKLIILTDTHGIMEKTEDSSTLLSSLSLKDIEKLKNKGIVRGGMLPKVDASMIAVKGGVKKVHIIDGRIPHAILLEIFTNKGIGTEILS